MRYNDAVLIGIVPSGVEDELGNELMDNAQEVVSGCRFTEWTSDDIAIYGRELSSRGRKLMVRPLTNGIAWVDGAIVAGERYEVIKKIDLGRWYLFVLKGFR